MRGLYIHIPFCKKICNYCDFTKRVPKNKSMIDEYLLHLKEELLTYKKYFDSIKTIYIGGGTPTLLDIEELKVLFDMLIDFKNIEEFTIEINPETLTKEKALLIKEAGVNRCSIGVESFDENILKILGRSHTKTDVYNAIKHLKEVGISNINIDLIFATPGSDLSSVENDLKEFYKLDINHLSYYSLILEENTIFYSMYKKDKLILIDNDLEAKMYEYIINDLEKNGFKQYEISNFAKDGYESVHNKIYWLNKEYIGVGLGASGYLDGVRYTNNTVLNEYYKKYRKSTEIIDFNTKFSEEMILGLRLSRGINIEYVNKTYKKDLLKDFKDIEKYIKSGDLVIEDGYLHLTKKGMLIANDIFVLFI